MTHIQGSHSFDVADAAVIAQLASTRHSDRVVKAERASVTEMSKSGVMILDSTISRVYRDRDFGRVEANVTFLIKRPGQPVRPVTIRTNVLVRGNDPLRQRLTEDARRLVDQIVMTPVDLPRVA